MRSVIAWSDAVPERDGVLNTVWDISFKPDGSQLVVGVGNRVLVYDAIDGDLLHSLKGHKDTVYAVGYSRDGKRFASGGADNTIIIWTSKATGILKYSHSESIQRIAYNPVTQQLASCTSSDFGLWSPEQKSVDKHKTSSKILCCSWTNDGQYLAIGLYSGLISIRDKAGGEKTAIERTAPIWAMQWNPCLADPNDVLAVGCWDQTLSFYQLSGAQVGKDRELGYDPCTVSYMNDGTYLVVGGSNKAVTLHTKEGVKLLPICADAGNWAWCAAARPNQNFVAVGTHGGQISMHQLIFSTVHGLYKDRYAFRDSMTDVIVQHLITEQKVRIKCRDYVKKIAVYRNRLAVQLPDRVIVYELSNDDPYDLHYRVREKITGALNCNLLVVTANHVILCLERKLQLYDFRGKREKEWVLESVIRYIKVVGGPRGREGLLVGLKNGLVLRIFVDNPFPIRLVKHSCSIRCLDISASRRKLAVVDENASCLVFSVDTGELLFQEENANSVAWNTELEEMLCFSGNGMLSIKTGTFPLHQQKLQGFVVGFSGSKIFCLHCVAMQTIDVPQSASLYRYLENKNYDKAYRVACLGVTESDWRLLAMTALQGMALTTARKAFVRVHDMRYIELLNSIEQEQKRSASSAGDAHFANEAYLAEVLAYQGRYQDAAKLFKKCGHVEKAIDMFSDLRQWEQAKVFAEGNAAVNVKDLIKRQAEWSEEVSDWKAASEMYAAAGDYGKAVQIIGERGWVDDLIEVARTVPASDVDTLRTCAEYFQENGHHQFAKEVYLKMDDVQNLMRLHIQLRRWDDAFILAEQNKGKFSDDVFLPYADWLAENDRFDEAQAAYKKAGRPDKSNRMLESLTHSAVVEMRYEDAAFYFWLLAKEYRVTLAESRKKAGAAKARARALTKHHQDGGEDGGKETLTPAQRMLLQKFRHCQLQAELYYAYGYIHQYVHEPFTPLQPEAVFNLARFLVSTLGRATPFGISRMNVLFALARQSKSLQAFKLARYAFDKLQLLKIPTQWSDELDLSMVDIQSKPFKDRSDLLPICYRCQAVNPLVNAAGDFCSNCGHVFVRSFLSFDVLPLVKFSPPHECSDAQAERLALEDPPVEPSTDAGDDDADTGRERAGRGGADVMTNTFAPNGDEEKQAAAASGDERFNRLLSAPQRDGDAGVRVDAALLRALKRRDVFVCKHAGMGWGFYKNMIPEMAITMCEACNHFFHGEDFEFAVLQRKGCPFCRDKAAFQGEINDDES